MYHIGMGIAGNVYAGTTRKLKNGGVMWIKKDDVTNEFYETMLGMLMNNKNELRLTEDGVEKYIIRLEVKE